MADETQTTSTEAPEPTAPAPEAPKEKTVPYERFTEVNQRAKEAQDELKELQDRLQELEDRDKTELERERSQRERLQTEVQERDARLTSLERSSWVRDAASEAKFIDPADALGRVDLSEIEAEADAKRAVKKVAESAKHLIQSEQQKPAIGKVLEDGRPADPAAASAAASQERQQEGEEFVQELRDALSDGATSVPGLLER